jgi:hypothetical protein
MGGFVLKSNDPSAIAHAASKDKVLEYADKELGEMFTVLQLCDLKNILEINHPCNRHEII